MRHAAADAALICLGRFVPGESLLKPGRLEEPGYLRAWSSTTTGTRYCTWEGNDWHFVHDTSFVLVPRDGRLVCWNDSLGFIIMGRGITGFSGSRK